MVGHYESRGAHIEIDTGREVAHVLLAELPEAGGYGRTFGRVPAGWPGHASAWLGCTRPDGDGPIGASRFGDG
jgi:hypothetical protein